MVNNDIHLLNAALETAILAGEKIMGVYNGPETETAYKDDRSPVTLADREASALIESRLASLDIPIISEESELKGWNERKDWDTLWMVDPLDGTREFLKRNGEFTVNIALIRNKKPVLGVIYAPVLNVVYFGMEGHGAFKCKVEGTKIPDAKGEGCEKLPCAPPRENLVVVASRSHMNDETKKYLEMKIGQRSGAEIIGAGSSLKICMVAEGKADLYPRFGTTMEWDIAAGQAIAEAAGAQVLEYPAGRPPQYNKEDLRNPWFLVTRE